MDRIASSIPFNFAAQAYGVRPAARPTQTVNAQPVQGAERTEPIARIGQDATPRPAADPSRLVAGKVDPIDLARDVAEIGGRAQASGAYPMYRHPADRNQAATAVALGRSLDVKG